MRRKYNTIKKDMNISHLEKVDVEKTEKKQQNAVIILRLMLCSLLFHCSCS